MTRIEPAAIEQAGLYRVRGQFIDIGAGLDERFNRAGRTLASAHELVEGLIASLEGVAGALDKEAGQAAVAEMQATADYLMAVPGMQAERSASVDTIRSASDALMRYVAQIERTLSFLQICGLNLKVASAGAEEFAGFVDEMFSRLEFAQAEVRGLEGDVRAIGAGISGMVELDKVLVAECARVIPDVPRQLVADADALRLHQDAAAALAGKVTMMARAIREKVGIAIGALQIGDITRQRLEHVVDGLAILDDYRAGSASDACSTDRVAAVTGHCVALLAAQANDAMQAFQSQSRRLTDSLDTLGPDALRLLALREGEGREDAGAAFLRGLERGIEEVDVVTTHLHRSSVQSHKLGSETTAMADRLSRRLRAVRKVQRDVAQMAWNTGLRCRNMGQDGQGLAVMSTEIRNFAHSLAEVWAHVSDTFDRLVAGAALIGSANEPNDSRGALTEALGRIRSGGERVEAGLASLDQHAPQVAALLRETGDALNCDTTFGAELANAVGELNRLGKPVVGSVDGAIADELAAVLHRIDALYTMARERDVHGRFAPA
ncbi:MAG TPA: hypothetical protein VF503_04310 [Sphingobium sp.]|uniref:hypothetical protein n=1 Tax=Sphingobium sp. TaxID=1912891 RepID=UPI002ED613D1